MELNKVVYGFNTEECSSEYQTNLLVVFLGLVILLEW